MTINSIGGGRWDNFLATLFNLKARPVATSVGMDIQPVVLAEPDYPEHAYLRDERIYAGSITQAGVAGQHSETGLLNAAGSNTLCIIEYFRWFAQAATDVEFGLNSGPVGTPILAEQYPRDSRQTAAYNVGQLVRSTAAAPIAGINRMWSQPVNPTFGAATYPLLEINFPIIVSPNWTFLVECQTVNLQATLNVVWRERSLNPAEE